MVCTPNGLQHPLTSAFQVFAPPMLWTLTEPHLQCHIKLSADVTRSVNSEPNDRPATTAIIDKPDRY